ncbi:MAG TPA: GNAT family N-acetyltransferase [Roseiflexaceae bacterium]|nr:GNAT family N-acetyltransferase [Roseiflexaceae bacterium]
MTTSTLSDPAYRRDLGGGLVLRWSTAHDADQIAALYSDVFRNSPNDPPNMRTAAYGRDLISGRHPLIDSGDFALVEDTDQGRAVAATCLIGQTWSYEGIDFPVGRPEIVASDADYRNRGLVRAVFELIHARSAANGHVAQGITGIPYYYRQFGYEYALDLGGSRSIAFDAIPKLKDGEQEPYMLREATPEDLPEMQALYERERSRAAITAQIDHAYWQFMFDGHSLESGEGFQPYVIGVRSELGWEGNPLGYVLTRRILWGDTFGVACMAVREGEPLMAILPGIMRQLQAIAPQVQRSKADQPPPTKLAFGFGRSHPVYDVLHDKLFPGEAQPYAWYVRVPDLPGFVRRIAPVLEHRLAASAAAGYTGDLKLTFYRGGLHMVFENGRLNEAVSWQAPVQDSGAMAGFPPLVFLQLLFGHRNLHDLRHAFPDVWANETGRALLEALFPPRLAWVLPLD